MLKTPDGQDANNIDRVMLLSMWAQHLEKEGNKVIKCGMGKPTYPINITLAKYMIRHWEKILDNALQVLEQMEHIEHLDIDELQECAIDYGDPRGELEARKIMAEALNNWYGQDLIIQPQNILFTNGGAGAINIIFDVFKSRNQKCKFITQLPYYSLYSSHLEKESLILIDTLHLPGYRITADAIKKAIEEEGSNNINAILICEPNNPMGTTINPDELKKILELIGRYPNIYLIIDGAYEEMRFDGSKIDFGDMLSSVESRKQLIILRSATKGLSAAGERMAIVCAFDDELMAMLLERNIKICGHSPISHQYAYANSLKELNVDELNRMREFYHAQVTHVQKRLKEIGISLSKFDCSTSSTFYVLADLHELINERSLSLKKVKSEAGSIIKCDEDIIYTLLLEDKIMLCPLSYFGAKPELGYIRITCSVGIKQLDILISKIDNRLKSIRKKKLNQIIELNKNNPYFTRDNIFISLDTDRLSSLELKLKYEEINRTLNSLKKGPKTETNRMSFFVGNPVRDLMRKTELKSNTTLKNQIP